MNLIDYTLRLDVPPGERVDVEAALKRLAERYPGGAFSERRPYLRVLELGRPVGQCFHCGGLVCDRLDGETVCERCGEISEYGVARRVPKAAKP